MMSLQYARQFRDSTYKIHNSIVKLLYIAKNQSIYYRPVISFTHKWEFLASFSYLWCKSDLVFSKAVSFGLHINFRKSMLIVKDSQSRMRSTFFCHVVKLYVTRAESEKNIALNADRKHPEGGNPLVNSIKLHWWKCRRQPVSCENESSTEKRSEKCGAQCISCSSQKIWDVFSSE